MSQESFIRYVGEADFHDGVIVGVEHRGSAFLVILRGASGREYTVMFKDVQSVKMNRPEGMMLYAISECPSQEHREFVFANWDEENDSALEVIARCFEVT